jgi:hypothetical protein
VKSPTTKCDMHCQCGSKLHALWWAEGVI